MAEITGSLNLLKELTGRDIRTFSYPYGAHDERSVRVVQSAGLELACIVGGGLVKANTDPYRLPRLMVRDLGGRAFDFHFRSWKASQWLA